MHSWAAAVSSRCRSDLKAQCEQLADDNVLSIIDVAGIIVVDNMSEELEAFLCHDSRLLACGRCLTIGDAAHRLP